MLTLKPQIRFANIIHNYVYIYLQVRRVINFIFFIVNANRYIFFLANCGEYVECKKNAIMWKPNSFSYGTHFSSRNKTLIDVAFIEPSFLSYFH